MDNGANTCKIGFAGQTATPISAASAASTVAGSWVSASGSGGGGSITNCKLIPNCATKPKRERRLFVGDQCDEIIDFSALNYRRPFERGYVVNWELQTMIWDRCFGSKNLNVCTVVGVAFPGFPFFFHELMSCVVVWCLLVAG